MGVNPSEWPRFPGASTNPGSKHGGLARPGWELRFLAVVRLHWPRGLRSRCASPGSVPPRQVRVHSGERSAEVQSGGCFPRTQAWCGDMGRPCVPALGG